MILQLRIQTGATGLKPSMFVTIYSYPGPIRYVFLPFCSLFSAKERNLPMLGHIHINVHDSMVIMYMYNRERRRKKELVLLLLFVSILAFLLLLVVRIVSTTITVFWMYFGFFGVFC